MCKNEPKIVNRSWDEKSTFPKKLQCQRTPYISISSLHLSAWLFQFETTAIGITDPMLAPVALVALMGCACVLFTVVCFVRYSTTPVIKATGKPLTLFPILVFVTRKKEKGRRFLVSSRTFNEVTDRKEKEEGKNCFVHCTVKVQENSHM